MGMAEDQNLAARWRRCTLVSGGGKSIETVLVGCVSFSGVVVEERGSDESFGCVGVVNALAPGLVVNTSINRR